MFRWYQNAEICYAYLSDVDDEMIPSKYKLQFQRNLDYAGRPYKTILKTPQATQDSFEKSRWFTRGWTLQELIAPSVVIFYSQLWCCLGDRYSLSFGIKEITGIRLRVLGRKGGRIDDLSQYSIAERMSWAASRMTTRKEDTAYSLLGIFEVNMPLLYGEGERAFQRLQEEVMKAHNDQSLFVWGLVKSASAPRMDIHDRCLMIDSAIQNSDVSGLFAQSPADFAQCGNVEQKEDWPGLSTGDDYPLPPMMMGQGLRIQIPLLFDESDAGLRGRSDLKGRDLCKWAYFKKTVCFAVLNCGFRDESKKLAEALTIPLVAWSPEHFGRWGQPVCCGRVGLKMDMAGRQKVVYIKDPAVGLKSYDSD